MSANTAGCWLLSVPNGTEEEPDNASGKQGLGREDNVSWGTEISPSELMLETFLNTQTGKAHPHSGWTRPQALKTRKRRLRWQRE